MGEILDERELPDGRMVLLEQEGTARFDPEDWGAPSWTVSVREKIGGEWEWFVAFETESETEAWERFRRECGEDGQ